jgi:hypothetical protein
MMNGLRNVGARGGLAWALALGTLVGCGCRGAAQGVGGKGVYVNGARLSPATLDELSRRLGIRAVPGRYWYDSLSGLVGAEGQGTTGAIPAGLNLGGPLRADASAGTSGVYLNGRQLTGGEVAFLRALLQQPIRPGRYWLDAAGNAGPEGRPAVVNLAQRIRQMQPTAAAPRRRSSVLGTYDRTGIHVLGDGSAIFPSTDWSSYGSYSR